MELVLFIVLLLLLPSSDTIFEQSNWSKQIIPAIVFLSIVGVLTLLAVGWKVS